MGTTRVFVFGTLKQGFPSFATNRGIRMPRRCRTVAAYPLYLVGERHVPWMLDAAGQGCRVFGVVFRSAPRSQSGTSMARHQPADQP